MREILTLVFAAALAASCIAVIRGESAAWPMVIWSAIFFFAMLTENWRYRNSAAAKAGDWVETDERFVDPESGVPLKVMYSPKTGERKYVPDENQQA